SQKTSEPLEQLLPVSDEQRTRSHSAVEAAARARSGGAAFLLVNALALDPWNTDAHAALTRAVHSPAGVEGARSFATLAFADELVAAPEMLTEYGECFSGADDATLVVLGDPHEIAQLGSALESVGLDGDDGPDMLAMARGVATAVATQVHAVYSRRTEQAVISPAPLVGDPA